MQSYLRRLFFYVLTFWFGLSYASGNTESLRIYLPAKLKSFDPVEVSNVFEIMLLGAFCSTLTRVDERGEVRGHLLKRWTISKDQKMYQFELKKNVRFHDGSEVTSLDVVYSISRHFWSTNTSGIRDNLQLALGGPDVIDPGKNIENIKQTGRYSFSIQLPKPYINFINMLSQNSLCILKVDNPKVASGPMVPYPRGNGSGWTLKSFQNYFSTSNKSLEFVLVPTFSGKEVEQKLENQAKGIFLGNFRVGSVPGNKYREVNLNTFSINHFFLNPYSKSFGDKDGRAAIAMLLQRVAHSTAVRHPHQEPTTSLIPTGDMGSARSFKYNSEIEGALGKVTRSTKVLSFVFMKYLFDQSFYDELERALKKVKIRYQIRFVDGAGLVDALSKGAFDVSHIPMTPAFPDPDGMFLGIDGFFKNDQDRISNIFSKFRHSVNRYQRIVAYRNALSAYEKKMILVPGFQMEIPLIYPVDVNMPRTVFRNNLEIWNIETRR